MDHKNQQEDEWESKHSRIKQAFSRFANKTSMSGVIFISHAKNTYVKLLWSILLMGAMGIMVYHLYFLITNFLEYKTSTTIVIGFNNLQLPAVTICNANPFLMSELNRTRTKLQELVTSTKPSKFIKESKRSKRFVDDLENLNLTAFDSTSGDSHDPSRGKKDPISNIQESFQNLFMKENKKTRFEIGHQIDKLLLRCSFFGYECMDNFTLYQTQEFGNCFTLQSRDMKVVQAGPDGGLTLVLYIETHEYLPGITEGYGARVTIHPLNTIPFPQEVGFFVDAGRETSIALQQIKISRLPYPHGECTTKNDFAGKFKREYNRESCQFMCLGSTVMESCDCYDPRIEQILESAQLTSKPCRSPEERQCLRDITSIYRDKKLPCHCPEPCREHTYSKTITSRTWPTETYASLLREAVCQNSKDDCKDTKSMDAMQLSRNFVKINIYYEDLNFQTIMEEADIENSQFFSDLGGAVGLWIGLSVLSLFEVVHLMVKVCTLSCKSKSPGKRSPSTKRTEPS